MVKKKKIKEQCLVFDRRIFKTKRAIKDWLRRHNYKLPRHKKDPIRKYDNEYRVLLKYAGYFHKNTFRAHKIQKGIKIIKGYLKPRK